MRVALAAAVFASFALLPYVIRPLLLARATPGLMKWYGATSLLGIAAGFVALLAAIVSPGPLPIADLPKAVEVCLDAAARLLAHPLAHWPSIFAAIVLIGAVVRLVYAAVAVSRDGRRARPPREPFPGEGDALARYLGGRPPSVRLLPVDAAVAFTTGIVRPVIVVSEGLMSALDAAERTALLAHERAHASRRHPAALAAARILARAFGFVPGVRVCVDLLVTALEARADDEAASVVTDPLVVARALAAAARLSLTGPLTAAGISDGEIAYRIRRLTGASDGRTGRGLVVLLVVVTLAMGFAQGTAWSEGRRALTRERIAIALHDTCHPPHAS